MWCKDGDMFVIWWYCIVFEIKGWYEGNNKELFKCRGWYVFCCIVNCIKFDFG